MNTLLPTCNKVIYTLCVKSIYLDSINSLKASSTAAWFWNCLFVVKLSRCLKKLKSVGGSGRTSIPKLFNFVCVTLATCGRALSWRRIGPFMLTKTGCFCATFSAFHLTADSILRLWLFLLVTRNYSGQFAVHHTVTMHFFWWNSGFRKSFGASFLSSH